MPPTEVVRGCRWEGSCDAAVDCTLAQTHTNTRPMTSSPDSLRLPSTGARDTFISGASAELSTEAQIADMEQR